MKIAAFAVPLLAVLTLAGCAVDGPIGAVSTPTPTAFAATGSISVPINVPATITLQGGHGAALNGECVSKDGYDDIASGAQVIISDASDKKVAIGQLDDGQLVAGTDGGTQPYQTRCEYTFHVNDIPKHSKIYSVHLGNEARGEQSYTREDLASGIELTIG